MKIKKTALVGGFVVGTAVAFAPLAAADTTGISSVVDAEISSANSLFDTEAVLSGIPSNDVANFGSFDFVFPQSITPTELTTLDGFLYGLDPSTPASDVAPQAYAEFDGALINFDNAFNVELYALLNGGALDTNGSDFFGGSFSDVTGALGTDSVSGAVSTFLTEGWHELLNYFDIGAATVY